MLDGRAAIAVDQDPGALLHLHPHPRLQQHHPHRHPLQKSKGCHNIDIQETPLDFEFVMQPLTAPK